MLKLAPQIAELAKEAREEQKRASAVEEYILAQT